MRPVLEDPTLAAQAVERRVGQAADAGGERQAVRAVDGRHGVDLHDAEAPDRRLDLGRGRPPRPRRVALPRDRQPPRRGRLDRDLGARTLNARSAGGPS